MPRYHLRHATAQKFIDVVVTRTMQAVEQGQTVKGIATAIGMKGGTLHYGLTRKSLSLHTLFALCEHLGLNVRVTAPKADKA